MASGNEGPFWLACCKINKAGEEEMLKYLELWASLTSEKRPNFAPVTFIRKRPVAHYCLGAENKPPSQMFEPPGSAAAELKLARFLLRQCTEFFTFPAKHIVNTALKTPFSVMHLCSGKPERGLFRQRGAKTARGAVAAPAEKPMSCHTLSFVFLCSMLEFYPPLFERLLAWLRVKWKDGMSENGG